MPPTFPAGRLLRSKRTPDDGDVRSMLGMSFSVAAVSFKKSVGPSASSGLPPDRECHHSRFNNPPIQTHDLGRMDVACPRCRALHWLDERILESSAAAPKFNMCCGDGKVVLPP